MSLTKTAMTGAIGFALGAGLMMMPANQKLRKEMLKKVDQAKRMMGK